MNDLQESDCAIVPMKRPNKEAKASAEVAEGRARTKENAAEPNTHPTQSGERVSQGLGGVRQAAQARKQEKFTALLHHLTVDLLRDSFYALKRKASAGVDGVRWGEYENGVEERLKDLHGRVHRGAYRAQPSRRVYIPKGNGGQRPLGIACVEDKIVQQAVVTILNQIYEVDFRGFSYGFRPGRSPHQALDALSVGIERKPVRWILDGDIRGFFDHMDHGWTIEFLKHRIADNRILRLIQKWLQAGVSEQGEWSESKVGTPQGAVISPLLANVYLHYVFDLWVEVWREKVARGEVIVIRYADDLVVGFEYREDTEGFLREFAQRLGRFGLTLQSEKTRLIEFGRYAQLNRARRGEGNAETFTFLGFTHYCWTNPKGGFAVRRKTAAKRMRTKLQELKAELRKQMHQPVGEVGPRLKRVVEGYYRYHAVPENLRTLGQFRDRLCSIWRSILGRRSQRSRPRWNRIRPTFDRWIPRPRVLHPYASVRFDATHPRWEPCAVMPLARICTGGSQK
jgi:RNA-directed DNA polymerase